MRPPRTQIIVIASWLALGAALLPIAGQFSRPVAGTLGNASWSFTLSAAAVLGLVLAALAAVGTHAVIGSHPSARGGHLSHTAHHWATPAVLTAAACFHISRLQAPAAFIGALVGFGALSGILLALEYGTVNGDAPGYARARWALSALTYLVAALAFTAAVGAGLWRETISVACGLVAALLAVGLLRQPERTPDVVALYVVTIGLMTGLAADRLLLWGTEPVRAALILVLLLYALAGVMQHQLKGSASWLVRVEYLALLVVGTWALLQLW